MKFDKTFWLVLAAGVLIIGGATLFYIYQDEAKKQDEINQSIDTAQATLPNLIAQKTNLENQLAELEEELALALAGLGEAEEEYISFISTINYGDLLFYHARVIGVDLFEFMASESYDVEVDGIEYQITDFALNISGDIDNILTYLTKIEFTSDFKTASIDSVEITYPDPYAPEDDEEDSKPMAEIQLRLFAYEGE